MSQYAGVGGGAAAGAAAGGAMLTIGGKRLVFEPETIESTIAHFEGILDHINLVRQLDGLSFTGEPAALDFASSNAVENLGQSAQSLFTRLDEAQVQVQAAIDNLRANGSAYRNSDVVGPGSSGA